MTSNGLPVRPPRASAWLVELFASTQEADGVLGDLAEEFNSSVERDGVEEARRHYQRQAWRTIRDLAVSPLRARSTFILTAGIGLAGLIMTWPISGAVSALARAIVTRYPVYYYVPASAFWGGVNLLGPLMTGFLVALAARVVRFRPMSAALAMVAVMAVMLAIDTPIGMWLYGPPLVRITLASSIVRWVRGVVVFGGEMLVGAAIGRMMAARDNPVQLRPSTQ